MNAQETERRRIRDMALVVLLLFVFRACTGLVWCSAAAAAVVVGGSCAAIYAARLVSISINH